MPIKPDELTVALTRLGDLALDSLQIIDAEALAGQRYPHLDPAAPVLVLGLADVDQVTTIATALLLAYPASQPCALLDDAGRHELTLGELSQVALASGAGLWIAPLASPGEYAALQDVVARLRAPDGCPWDRELTWAKMRASVLEEAHELLDALDADDPAKVAEELGDLLLQVALLTQIATEEGHFRFPEVIAHIVEKLIRRHPHVFGDVEVSGTDEVLANWEAIKRAERAANGDAAQKRSPLAGIPKGLPALAQAEAYLDRMSRLRESHRARRAVVGPGRPPCGRSADPRDSWATHCSTLSPGPVPAALSRKARCEKPTRVMRRRSPRRNGDRT